MCSRFCTKKFVWASRSSHPEVFCKKAFLEIRKIHRKTPVPGSLLAANLRPATLLNKRLWHRCFPANFVKFLRKTFLTEHLRWLLLSIIFQQIFLYYFIPLGAISFPYYTALSVLVFKFTNFVRWLIQFISFFVERSSISLKVGLSPSKKNCFIYLNESSLKLIKMLFYFILKAHFVFKIFKF